MALPFAENWMGLLASPNKKRRPGPRHDLPWAGVACVATSGISLAATCVRLLTVHFASKRQRNEGNTNQAI